MKTTVTIMVIGAVLGEFSKLGVTRIGAEILSCGLGGWAVDIEGGDLGLGEKRGKYPANVLYMIEQR
ncbi:hypothetical protein CL657_02310 [bacterium]|nr:hypothetical protein [bacterium]